MRKKPIVAILYDFDSTLSRTDMQNFGFIPSLGMTPAEFWGATGKFSEETGCERTLAYLYMMQKLAAEKGIKMTKEWLKEQGKGIEFYNGVETWFDRINAYGKEHGVNVEHYLISSGNKEIVEGCKIAKQFKVIYGCEYIFDPVTGVPVWPKLAINYTQKTQYFFRISKGAVDATDDKGVNEKAKEKRIPYSGGKSIAVYPKGKEDRVKDLYDDGRVNYVCPANYKEGSEIEKVMKLIIQGVAINESLKTRENQNVMQD